MALRVYDVLEEVATLVNEMEDGGWKSVVWGASGMASGIYDHRSTPGTFSETKKLLFLK
ncbi:MAG: hypothetical protein ABSF91_13080 [Bacteroidota bacterium]